MRGDAELLLEQQEFYRHRALEYDDWWLGRGRYDRDPESRRRWQSELPEVEAALESFGEAGTVLELAGGTGWWTARLARTAGSLTVVDSSAETLELNRSRVRRDDVRYVTADLFEWAPDRSYDVVFFSFWLSHVPLSRFEEFWSLVRSCLAPGGRCFLVDNLRGTISRRDPYVIQESDEVQRRRLEDGSEYRVVKLYWEPEALERRLGGLGWRASVLRTAHLFVYGWASPDGAWR